MSTEPESAGLGIAVELARPLHAAMMKARSINEAHWQTFLIMTDSPPVGLSVADANEL